MTNRATAELRELSRELYDIAQPLEGKTPFGKLVRIADRLATLSLSLPQPPALGGIVQEIDGLFEKATGENWEAVCTPDNPDDYVIRTTYRNDEGLRCTSFPAVCRMRPAGQNETHSKLITRLVNAWPTLRANLKQEEWRPIEDQKLKDSVEQALTDYWCDEGMTGTEGFLESLNAYGVQVVRSNWTPGDINAAFESSANQYELIERIGRELLNSHYLTAELIYEIHSVLGWQDGAPTPPQSKKEG